MRGGCEYYTLNYVYRQHPQRIPKAYACCAYLCSAVAAARPPVAPAPEPSLCAKANQQERRPGRSGEVGSSRSSRGVRGGARGTRNPPKHKFQMGLGCQSCGVGTGVWAISSTKKYSKAQWFLACRPINPRVGWSHLAARLWDSLGKVTFELHG